MSQYYYDLCCQHIESPVEIRCHDGGHYVGIIDSVDGDMVFLRPFDDRDLPPGGYDGGPGLFLWGFGPAFIGGFAGGLLGVAIGSIAFFRPYALW